MSTVDGQTRLNATSGALLGLLLRNGPMTGGELERTAKVVIGGYWTLTRSQIYRELVALASRGLLRAGPTGARDAQPYGLTEAGEAAFLTWLAQGPGEDTIRLPILLTVGFGASLPVGRLAKILDDYQRRHEERLAHVRFLDTKFAADGEDVYVRATVSFGLIYEEAVQRWLAELPAELRTSLPRGRESHPLTAPLRRVVTRLTQPADAELGVLPTRTLGINYFPETDPPQHGTEC